MTHEKFAQHIAARVAKQELTFCTKIGMTKRQAAVSAFLVLQETYCAVLAAERPAVLTRFRPMPHTSG